jgi:hypothetical protein
MTSLQHAGVYLSFLGPAAGYTWPLVTNLGGLLPPNGDPRLFSWVLITIFGNLTTRPALLFHGNAFYPFGNMLSFAEPLLVPALVAGPLHAWTDNPVLAYNVTLLLFWAFSGWAMYWVAWRVTGSHPAAFLAGMIFTFAPYRIDHYMEFQMEMAFGIPLATTCSCGSSRPSAGATSSRWWRLSGSRRPRSGTTRSSSRSRR